MRFCICLESSHAMGMGHLFRALNLASFLRKVGATVLFVLNRDAAAERVLQERNVRYETVDLSDSASNWEADIIRHNGCEFWINDRLATDRGHAEHVVTTGARLITFDDMGSGAELADIHFAQLPCMARQELTGKRVLTGIEYLVLNSDICHYRRARRKLERLVVTLGGTDTHGVTVRVAQILRDSGRRASIITGPGFRHMAELERIAAGTLEIKTSVPSLVKEFDDYDLAITGGGITPFEANAAGLPCVIIANEPHEADNALFLSGLGSSMFVGGHGDLHELPFPDGVVLARMSRAGLEGMGIDGAERIHRAILEL